MNLSLPLFFRVPTPSRTAEPPPPRRPAPVFIHDAVTPWGAETMLLHVLREATPTRDQDE